jgi:hypothetical protein
MLPEALNPKLQPGCSPQPSQEIGFSDFGHHGLALFFFLQEAHCRPSIARSSIDQFHPKTKSYYPTDQLHLLRLRDMAAGAHLFQQQCWRSRLDLWRINVSISQSGCRSKFEAGCVLEE